MDKYDPAIEYLTQHPEMIKSVWDKPDGYKAGALFQYAAPNGDVDFVNGKACGCLTLIRRGDKVAWTEELTTAIRRDVNIPASRAFPNTFPDIQPEHLEHFAKWQRRIDLLLDRPREIEPAPEKQEDVQEVPL